MNQQIEDSDLWQTALTARIQALREEIAFLEKLADKIKAYHIERNK